MAGLLAILCAVMPFANLPLAHFTAFIPVYATAMAIIDLTTAALIFAQFWVVRWTWLLVLGCGFLFTGLIAIPYGLAFPEGFAPSGLLGSGSQTAAQLSLCTRWASPIAVIAAVLVRDHTHATAGAWRRPPGLTIALCVVLITAAVCALTWAVAANEHLLPRISVNSLQDNLALLLPVIALTLVAFALMWTRGRSVFDLWLMIMCSAWLLDLALVIIGNSRYTLGWYAGRFFQLQAVFIVLLLLLSEQTALYANMARASVVRLGTRQERQIAMDMMAASIGHEIKQPLTGLLFNAEAGLCQLKGVEPGPEDTRAILADIVADGRRIQDIVGGVRKMFRESAHDRQLLDINRVVRDVLATVSLELRQQHVTVKTDLDNDLSPVLADRGQLHQLFLNLVTNALEAMDAVRDRPAVLRLTSGIVAGSSDIAVTVEDTGLGMPDKDDGRVLHPFYSTKAAGTGVGLTICSFILKAHGGNLHIGANKPHGTIMRVVLPGAGAA
jgi:signal transduction histidine kinase